jgi:Na+/phosphate symporter
MDSSTPAINKTLFILCGVAFAAPCLFFLYYSARLLFVNLTMEDAAAHRTGGMLIGAIAFPLAAAFFGLVSWFFFKRSRTRQMQ